MFTGFFSATNIAKYYAQNPTLISTAADIGATGSFSIRTAKGSKFTAWMYENTVTHCQQVLAADWIVSVPADQVI